MVILDVLFLSFSEVVLCLLLLPICDLLKRFSRWNFLKQVFDDDYQILDIDDTVAPRALLCNEGTKDSWTNPQGSQLTHLAAKKVYGFLEAGDQISIRYRPVGHVPNNEDLLDFADYIFFKKPLSEEFGKLPYPREKNGFTWDIPK